MSEKVIYVANFWFTDTFGAAGGVVHRMNMQLGKGQIGSVMQVMFHFALGLTNAISGAVSLDPDEEEQITGIASKGDTNLISQHQQFLTLATDGHVNPVIIPIPEPGIDFATDLSYMFGVSTGTTITHGVSVWYRRRRARANEFEALTMARR